MTKGKKFILILGDLFLLTIILPVLFHSLGKLGYQTPIQDFTEISYIGKYLPSYFLFGSIVVGIVLLVLLLVILFYPKRYMGILLGDGSGKLVLKNSAIEGFVRQELENSGYLKNPKVDSFLGKNKVKVDIKGEIIPRVQIAEKTQLIEEEIRNGLKEFLGVKHNIRLKVKVNAVTDKSKSSSRVV